MSPYLNPMGKMFELVPTSALIVVAGFAVSVLLAQNDFDSIRQAAEKGDAEAQFNLAAMYDQGEGGAPPDEAEAVRWYRRASEQGHAAAQFNLGNMYADGRGVLKDEVEAVRWFRVPAEQGDAAAQFNLGGMYADGEGITKDEAEAVRWYRRAAKQGYAAVQFNLGSSMPKVEASSRIPCLRTCGSTSRAPPGTNLLRTGGTSSSLT